jgi:hypothetical protein
MRKFAIAAFVLSTVMWSQRVSAQEAPPMPEPTEEHKWLEQLVGDWKVASEMKFGPDTPAIKCEGKESVRKLGGFWTISETNGDWMGNEVTGVMTLGYDPKTKKYVGTWVDSATNHLWHYVGTLDDAKKVLTLEAEGDNPLAPGKKAKFRDVITIKDKDTKVMTSSMQMDDGSWTQFMTANYTRRK